ILIPYFPLRDEVMKQIVTLKLDKIQRRIRENHKVKLTYDPQVIEEVVRRCTEVESGARNVDNILTNTLLPDISRRILTDMAELKKIDYINVGICNGGFQYS